jgi:hypothetical protein
MNRRRRTLLLGLALVAGLAGGIVATLLWLAPCDAERFAAKIGAGMRRDEVLKVVNPPPSVWQPSSTFLDESPWVLNYFDGSILSVEFTPPVEGGRVWVTSVRTTPPPPVHPLTRLRRTLARALPFLGE